MKNEEEFKIELSNLLGKECWGIVGGVGTGSVISLSIGKKIEKTVPSKNPHLSEIVRRYNSEYSIMISCPWRIESKTKILCGSHHRNESDGPYSKSFMQIIGKTISNIRCESPAYDLKLVFGNELSLIIHCSSIGMDEEECYSFGTPLGWFTVQLDGVLDFDKRI